jgi:integral membrane protein
MRAALTRYRVMAYVTGVSLIILVFVMIPLRYIGGHPTPSMVFSPFHGLMFMLYVVTVFDLFTRMKWSLFRMLLVMLAGCVPFVSFVAEHRVHLRAEEEFARRAAARANAETSDAG